MKKTRYRLTFTLTLLMSLSCFLRGQDPYISCCFDFENNPCDEASFIYLDIPAEQETWHISAPGGQIFNSAHSLSKAIVTDGSGSHPAAERSDFIIKIAPELTCMCSPVIGGFYKLDSDSLKDFGKIEFSLDQGTTWLNILADEAISEWDWVTPKPVFTGRIPHWTEFLAYIPGYTPGDTVFYRFTFVSDSILTNREGWMLDDISVIEHTETAKDPGTPDQINIFPNPATNTITVKIDNFSGEMEFSVYDMNCKLKLQKIMHDNEVTFDISGIGKGSYIIVVVSGESYKASLYSRN